MRVGVETRARARGLRISPGGAGTLHRPPPAQAQAHPAQAQAQAQLLPPPEDQPPPERDEGGGGGLVVLVTPLVKFVTFETRLLAVFWTPLTIEAANSEPGRRGIETPRPPGAALGRATLGPLTVGR